MAKSIKLKNNTYIDSKGITHNRKLLSDILYPIGSIYISVNSTSPATLFGGKWTQISGRFLYCTTTSKTTGGSNTHTLTVDEMPNHKHTIWTAEGGSWARETVCCGNTTSRVNGDYDSITAVGGGKAHNNMPAYFTVFCWYRTS